MEKSTRPLKAPAWHLTAKVLFLTLLVSCQEPKEQEIPPSIVPPDSMTLILTDVHIVEGAKVGSRIMGDTLRVEDYYKKVYTKHGISKERFRKSFDFYSTNPDEMAEIYEQVIENLNKIETQPPRESLHEEEPEDTLTEEAD